MRKTHSIRSFVLGMAVMLVICTTVVPTLASTATKQFTAVYRDIKLVVDGISVEPKDANGNIVEPFVFEGTTYLPLRPLAEALGKTVDWDGATSTVYIGARPGNVQYLVDVCPAYQSSADTWFYEYSAKKSGGKDVITMAGTKYTEGIAFRSQYYSSTTSTALYNLNGQYTKITGKIGHCDGTENDEKTLYVYADGVLIEEYKLTAEMMPQDIVIDVTGVLQLKFEMPNSKDKGWYAIVNPVIE